MLNFIKIKAIRPRLTTAACLTLVLMLCISHLDYANALLYGMTMKLKSKYQRFQNMCAKLVLNKQKYDSATKCLQELHWLPIEQRIQHKILLITHKALSGQAPKYIQELIKIRTPCRHLRSGHSGRLLCTPSIQKETFTSRSFSYAASVVWNPLPQHLWDENSTSTFKKHLKTYLFKKPSTCKVCEIVSHCILSIALYEMLYYVMLCYVVQGFLGFTNYYHKFIPKYAHIARPINQLVSGENANKKKTLVEWTEECQTAFEHLKHLCSQTPVLAYVNYQKPFKLHTDVSENGLGAVLYQKTR